MLDRATFIRPYAHRGLHAGSSDGAAGPIENSGPAFAAAITENFGIECDLQPAARGLPLVFHDTTLDRLVSDSGPLSAVTPNTLKTLRYRGQATPILTFAEMLEMVAGRVPLMVEIKSDFKSLENPDYQAFMKRVAELADAYSGPIALKSFDPAVMTVIRDHAPRVPRGIVSGVYPEDGALAETLGPARRYRLTHLLESGPVAPSFYNYRVDDLPTPVTRYVRDVQNLPLLAWTVRTPEHWATVAASADAAVFEGMRPPG